MSSLVIFSPQDVKPIDLAYFARAKALDPSQFPNIWKEEDVVEIRHYEDLDAGRLLGRVTWPRVAFSRLLESKRCTLEKGSPAYQELIRTKDIANDPFFLARLQSLLENHFPTNGAAPMVMFLTFPYTDNAQVKQVNDVSMHTTPSNSPQGCDSVVGDQVQNILYFVSAYSKICEGFTSGVSSDLYSHR